MHIGAYTPFRFWHLQLKKKLKDSMKKHVHLQKLQKGMYFNCKSYVKFELQKMYIFCIAHMIFFCNFTFSTMSDTRSFFSQNNPICPFGF
jgi:hypothetical protein